MSESLPPAQSRSPVGTPIVERIVYASRATDVGAIFPALESIRASALRKNVALDVTAALVYQSGWFVYWAEGPHQGLQAVLQHVARDTRHQDQALLHASQGPRLLDSAWSMMVGTSAETPEQFGQRVQKLYHMEPQLAQRLSPADVVRRLVSPMRLPQALQAGGDPERFHRIGVCAAIGHDAMDLVGWLAQTHHAPKVSRRVAGVSDHDSGTDYVDFMQGAQPLRVIALAQTDLDHAFRRVYLPQWTALALLLCEIDERNQLLLDRVDAAWRALDKPPPLIVFAPHVNQLDTARASAAQRHIHCVGGCVLRGDPTQCWSRLRDWVLAQELPQG